MSIILSTCDTDDISVPLGYPLINRRQDLPVELTPAFESLFQEMSGKIIAGIRLALSDLKMPRDEFMTNSGWEPTQWRKRIPVSIDGMDSFGRDALSFQTMVFKFASRIYAGVPDTERAQFESYVSRLFENTGRPEDYLGYWDQLCVLFDRLFVAISEIDLVAEFPEAMQVVSRDLIRRFDPECVFGNSMKTLDRKLIQIITLGSNEAEASLLASDGWDTWVKASCKARLVGVQGFELFFGNDCVGPGGRDYRFFLKPIPKWELVSRCNNWTSTYLDPEAVAEKFPFLKSIREVHNVS